ncbi:OmpA family protein [Egibacter rhizosphaerae]|uniref:OmpA family protein n=1 Tax=Egibacter rhizosphaerae TaxID=1670831 RepID=A0A411YH35_9ACTN|nr:OmpA family protein [Egibacter rhizosphaerae]QBI20655.1 OmpA family protein [Egibacter rhizosphaerae]
MRGLVVLISLAVLVLLAACDDAADDEDEATQASEEDAAASVEVEEGEAEAESGEAGSGETDGTGGDADEGGAPERPESDVELVEEAREDFLGEELGASEMETTEQLGSEIERIEELESRYDAEETEQGEVQLTVPDHVLFDFDSDELRPEAAEALDDIAEVIEHYEDAPVEIQGHTDHIGEPEYNLDLSERRAHSVVDYLVDRGVDEGRLTARGLGEEEPVAPNEHEDGSDNPEGRAQNRRVEVLIDE